MLATIRSFMADQSIASLAEIAFHLGTDPDSAIGMVEVWVRKGKITKLPLACGGCSQCDTATIEIYQWV